MKAEVPKDQAAQAQVDHAFMQAGPVNRDRAEAALEWLIENAVPLGQAKALRELAEDRLRVEKSIAMGYSSASSQSAKESEAYSSLRYARALEEKRAAILHHETLLAQRNAASTVIDLWRTIESTARVLRV